MSNMTVEDLVDVFAKEISRLDKRLIKLEEAQRKVPSKHLTPAEKEEIRLSKDSVKSLSLKYNRTRQQIYNIKRGG